MSQNFVCFSHQYFLNPLKKFLSAAEIIKVFVNIPVGSSPCCACFLCTVTLPSLGVKIRFSYFFMQDLVKVHKNLMQDVQDSILNKNALNLHQIFISYKERCAWTLYRWLVSVITGSV